MIGPEAHRVGLALTPPAGGPKRLDDRLEGEEDPGTPTARRTCAARRPRAPSLRLRRLSRGGRRSPTPPTRTRARGFYVVSSLSDDDIDGNPADDYVKKDANGVWDLNPSAPIVSTLGCIQAAGSTSYSLAIDEAAWAGQQARARQRPGRDRVLHRRGREHLAEPASDGVAESVSVEGRGAAARVSRRRSAFRGTRPSIRSATTSGTRPRRRSGARSRARRATRTTASRPRSRSRGARRRRKRSRPWPRRPTTSTTRPTRTRCGCSSLALPATSADERLASSQRPSDLLG